MQLKKLAVICPGIGYTEDKPLLYHSRRIAEAHGYKILTIRYSGLPKKVRGDRKKMEKNLAYFLIPGGNHSLETNEPMKDLIQLLRIMKTAEKYISAELQTGNYS